MTNGPKRLRVLSVDGGGMRGLYTAAYLSSLGRRYAVTRDEAGLDIGKGFDLIVGTSTGRHHCLCPGGRDIDQSRFRALSGAWAGDFSPQAAGKGGREFGVAGV